MARAAGARRYFGLGVAQHDAGEFAGGSERCSSFGGALRGCEGGGSSS